MRWRWLSVVVRRGRHATFLGAGGRGAWRRGEERLGIFQISAARPTYRRYTHGTTDGDRRPTRQSLQRKDYLCITPWISSAGPAVSPACHPRANSATPAPASLGRRNIITTHVHTCKNRDKARGKVSRVCMADGWPNGICEDPAGQIDGILIDSLPLHPRTCPGSILQSCTHTHTRDTARQPLPLLCSTTPPPPP